MRNTSSHRRLLAAVTIFTAALHSAPAEAVTTRFLLVGQIVSALDIPARCIRSEPCAFTKGEVGEVLSERLFSQPALNSSRVNITVFVPPRCFKLEVHNSRFLSFMPSRTQECTPPREITVPACKKGTIAYGATWKKEMWYEARYDNFVQRWVLRNRAPVAKYTDMWHKFVDLQSISCR